MIAFEKTDLPDTKILRKAFEVSYTRYGAERKDDPAFHDIGHDDFFRIEYLQPIARVRAVMPHIRSEFIAVNLVGQVMTMRDNLSDFESDVFDGLFYRNVFMTALMAEYDRTAPVRIEKIMHAPSYQAMLRDSEILMAFNSRALVSSIPFTPEEAAMAKADAICLLQAGIKYPSHQMRLTGRALISDIYLRDLKTPFDAELRDLIRSVVAEVTKPREQGPQSSPG